MSIGSRSTRRRRWSVSACWPSVPGSTPRPCRRRSTSQPRRSKMLTNKQIDALTNEERGAWIDGMSEDERMIVYTPVGYLHDMVTVSVIKRALTTQKLTTAEQLEMLEALGKIGDRYFTAEAVAAIKPICETGVQIVREARQTDRTEDRSESFMLLGSWEVFN